MKPRITYLLHGTHNSFNNPGNKKVLIIFSLAVLCTGILFLLAEKSREHNHLAATATQISPTVTLTSTKWWVMATTSSSPVYSSPTIKPKSTNIPRVSCQFDSSSNLQPGIYAYISLNPPLPNRVRSGAGQIHSYIGQIEPGVGIKIIDGPICADGFSWWLVESNDSYLRGWTAIGNGSEQWIIPCADPNTACSKVLIIPATSILTTQDNVSNKCNSYVFTGGMFAKVKQSDLLVIRSEPHTGVVIGYAGPDSKVKIIDGPSCTDDTTWWKVRVSTLNLTGWTTEANLTPCSKEECP